MYQEIITLLVFFLLYAPNSSHEPKISIINGGKAGLSLKDIKYYYQNYFRKYQPDLVILLMTNNMNSRNWIYRNENSIPPVYNFKSEISFYQNVKIELNRIIHLFALPSFIKVNHQRLLYFSGVLNHDFDVIFPLGPMFPMGLKQRGAKLENSIHAWDITEEYLSDLNKSIKKDGINLILLGHPERFLVSKTKFDNEKYVPVHRLRIDSLEQMKNLTINNDIYFINLLSEFKNFRKQNITTQNQLLPLYIPFDYMHLNPTGHEIVADKVFEEIESKQILNGKK